IEDSDDDFCVIRIGDEDREVKGKQRYVITYTYTYPDDRLPDKDYLFHTVLGTEFEEPIEYLAFRITFDKELPDDIRDRLKVYAGEYGKKSGMTPSLVVEASTTDIIGKANNIKPRHGVTLYAELPEGYYEGARTVNYLWLYIFLALTILTIVAIVYYQLKQKTPHVTKVIEFYPPEGISSAEVGTIIDESVDDIDITSLIPWLAGQGYISIKEQQKGKLFKSTDLELTKLKDLPSNAPGYQKQLMKLLFADKDVVNIKDIGEQPEQYKKITESLEKHFKGKRELTTLESPVFLYGALVLFGTLTLGFNTVVSTLDWSVLMIAALSFGAPCSCAIVFRVTKRAADLLHSSYYHTVQFFGKAVLMLATWVAYSIFIDYGVPLNQWVALAIYLITFFLNELAGRFSVDTDYRVQMMGRLLGFKEFIETAEKPRLEQLQADDPQYFYKVLPYAMVFELSDQWEDLFKDIKLEKPDWYDSATPLMGAALTHNMIHNFHFTASSAISTISHSSSGSGGGGGGGFSGGGGGGGGGGSW
ncbi:MAG: DUF2207 domain-containing protein, partial [Prevotella sp.]|nr:DUF2207 domain-containing protein [Prevotella sp.]